MHRAYLQRIVHPIAWSTGAVQAVGDGAGGFACSGHWAPGCPQRRSSAFGNARPEGLGMDVTKTLGNNVLLRFGTRLRALQNVIKILLMGQRGVETRGGEAARSRRAHMGAGRPCVQAGEGGSQPGGRPSFRSHPPIPF